MDQTLRRRALGPAPLTLFFLAVTLLSASCGGDDPGTTEPDPPRATTLRLSTTALNFSFLGETTLVTATILDQFARPFTATVAWSSDDATVASVDANGNVSAQGNGTTTVRATSGDLSASVAVTVQQVATRVSAVSGADQRGTVGQQLGEVIVVRSEDQGGSPVPGVNVTFTVADGSGSVSAATVTSDADAMASTTWTLGTTAGIQTVTAAVEGTTTGWAPIQATAVAGAAATLTKVSGDGQSGTTGLALSEPVVVKLEDQYGNGVSGGAVTFTVTGGGGSVDPGQATSVEGGTASATWTLGAGLGTNTLTASAEGLTDVQFTATAAAALADLQPATPTTSPTVPTTLDAFQVTSTVTNVGHLPTGTGFDVRLLVDGADAGVVSLAALGVSESADATFTVGPLDAGSHTLQVVADVNGAIVESDESNNSVSTTKTVPASTQVTAGTPITGVGASAGTELLFTLDVSAAEVGTTLIQLSGGTGDVDLYVQHGSRPAERSEYQCQSGSPATEERCVFNAADPGTYHILLYAFSDFSGTTLTATTAGEEIPYDIELVFIHRGSSSQDQAFEEAAAHWMSILRDDLNGLDFTGNALQENTCIDGQPLLDRAVDDMLIYVDIVEIDGPGGTLASAGPCIVDGLSRLPVVGSMKFDNSDLDALESNGGLKDVVLHEMGHVLGIGTIWDSERFDRLQNPSLPNNQGADTYFNGPKAIEAFDAAGGTTYTKNKVPVENLAGSGSGDSHWRESVLDEELMTPFYNSGQNNPLSAISIQSLADVGYRVDASQADAYSGVFLSAARVDRPVVLIDLRGDIRVGPILRVDPKTGDRTLVERR